MAKFVSCKGVKDSKESLKLLKSIVEMYDIADRRREESRNVRDWDAQTKKMENCYWEFRSACERLLHNMDMLGLHIDVDDRQHYSSEIADKKVF